MVSYTAPSGVRVSTPAPFDPSMFFVGAGIPASVSFLAMSYGMWLRKLAAGAGALAGSLVGG